MCMVEYKYATKSLTEKNKLMMEETLTQMFKPHVEQLNDLVKVKKCIAIQDIEIANKVDKKGYKEVEERVKNLPTAE